MKPSTKEKIYIIVILLLIAFSAQIYYSFRYLPANQIQVYYNQDHALNDEIISEIRNADEFVYFSVYTFTRADIQQALLAAKYRGIKVMGFTDHDQYNNLDIQKKLIDELRNNGITVYIPSHSGIMHQKILVTDKAYASGSYNWTAAATNLNDEVLEVGHDQNVRQNYQNILEEMFEKYGQNN
ncbi:MAG TPA: phospholipase D-like domain-containing protein [Candidatus Limnocylindria bacterium]|nr:phospholipase D-like domain-containing protein [Candidatus Limnocylindria bacterium]